MPGGRGGRCTGTISNPWPVCIAYRFISTLRGHLRNLKVAFDSLILLLVHVSANSTTAGGGGVGWGVHRDSK